jgi:hypothetical protein
VDEAGRLMTDEGTQLLADVETYAGKFLAFPNKHCLTVLVLWIAHTWALSAFYVTPRLVLDSPEPGSGKTRVLEILALLCRGAKLTLSTTTAALYRRIAAAGEHPPTILQDEADAVFTGKGTPQAEELRALYNSGYRRGATVDRCEGDAKNMVVREFPVFAPVALAGLAGKMPRTILDRAVALHMRRRAPDERVADFRERDAKVEAEPLRTRLEKWATLNLKTLEAARPKMPDGVRDRPAEVWEALLAVADQAGGDWPDRARMACRHFVLHSDPDELSFGARLLRDVRTAFGEHDRMFSADLVAALVANEEWEWADLWGKPLDQRRLAKELKRYGVVSDKLRIGDVQARGYAAEGDSGLGQAWQRYLHSDIERPKRPKRPDAGQGDLHPSHERPIRPTSVPDKTLSDQRLFENGTLGTLGTDKGESLGELAQRVATTRRQCGCGRPGRVRTDTGMCDWCTVKAANEVPA